jgi:pimeloyl-ACP methyl ester carboxylesterase
MSAQPPPAELLLPDGQRLAVRSTAGSAGRPGVLLLHGLGGSSSNWLDLVAEVGATFPVSAPDLPGYGDSPPAPDGDHGLAGLSRAAVALAEVLVGRGGGPLHLVGNSMGGLLAVRVAATRPDLVRTLALLSPALPPRRVPRDAGLLTLLAAPRIGELALARNRRRSPEQQALLSAAVIYGDPTAVPPERLALAVDERRRRAAQPHADAVFLGSLRSLLVDAVRRPGPWELAARVQAPTLVVYGERDRLVHHGAARRWRVARPGAQVVVLPGVGHVPQMERPDLVARLLRDFWS